MCSVHRPKSHHGAVPRGSRQAANRRGTVSRPPRTRTAEEKTKKSVADAARHARNKTKAEEKTKAAEEITKAAENRARVAEIRREAIQDSAEWLAAAVRANMPAPPTVVRRIRRDRVP